MSIFNACYRTFLSQHALDVSAAVDALVEKVIDGMMFPTTSNVKELIDPDSVNVRSGGLFPLLNFFIESSLLPDVRIELYKGTLISRLNRRLRDTGFAFEVDRLATTTLKSNDPEKWDLWITLAYNA